MKLPIRVLATLAVVVVPVTLQIACSSTTKKVTSGGAHYELVTPASGGPGACPDFTAKVTLAVKGDDGKTDKLVPDGQDGATAQCQFDDTHFAVQVTVPQGQAGFVAARGTFKAMTSTDAKISVGVTSGVYTSEDGACTVTFTEKDSGAGSLTGRFVCSFVDHTTIPGAKCGLTGTNPDGSPVSFFKFRDCSGF